MATVSGFIFANPVLGSLLKPERKNHTQTNKIKGYHKKAAFMMTYADTEEKKQQPMRIYYQTLLDYLNWEDAGVIIAPGVWTAGSIKSTGYGRQAYQLGKRL